MASGPFGVVTALLLVLGLGACGADAANCTVCLSGSCDATTIAGGIALTTADGEVVDVAPGVYDQEVPTLLNHTITLRLGQTAADTVTVVHAGAWLTVANASALTLRWGKLVLRGATLVVDADGELNQFADMVFDSAQGPSAIAILADASWRQHGNVLISNTTVTDALVDLAGGVWQQHGNTTLVATHGVSGVRFSTVGSFTGRWLQRGISNVSMTSSSSPNQVAAVDMSAGGLWIHVFDGPRGRFPHSYLTVSGSGSSGVYLGADGTWGQYSRLTVQADNQSTGVVLNSTGVWEQTGEATFDLVESTGIRFVGATSKLSQQTNIRITVGTNATGIEFANGGSWRQFANTTIKATSATATGTAHPRQLSISIMCASSASCCAQVDTPTLVKISSAQSTAGRENDCAISPSPSPVASVAPLTGSTTAAFDNSSSAVAISRSGAASPVGVQLSLSGLQLGFADDLHGLNVTRTITNSTDPNNGNALTSTIAYTAHIDAETSLVQSYTYYASARAVSFAGVNFTVRAGSVKWSFSLTTASWPSATTSVADAQRNGFSLRYRLSDLASSSSSPSSGGPSRITRRRNTPHEGMTTFFVALSEDDVVAQVEVLNAAIIDGAVTTLGRIELVFDNLTAADNQSIGGSGYFLELGFPPFAQSVEYDPSLGLGVLLGRSSDGSPSSSSTDVGLIVGVAVAIPVAVVVVLAAIVAGVALAWRRRRRWAKGSAANESVNWTLDEGEDPEQL